MDPGKESVQNGIWKNIGLLLLTKPAWRTVEAIIIAVAAVVAVCRQKPKGASMIMKRQWRYIVSIVDRGNRGLKGSDRISSIIRIRGSSFLPTGSSSSRHCNVGDWRVWRLFLLQASFQAIHAFQQCFEDVCFWSSFFGN